MALPKEPRQKMINIMYLVLTAILALNVSAEILEAFKTVDQSLQSSNANLTKSNETIYSSLSDQLKDQKTALQAAIWQPKAEQAHKLANDMTSYIEELKKQLKVAAGDKGNGDFKEDNLDASTRMFETDHKGDELKGRLEKFKADLLAIDSSIKTKYQNTLPINTDPVKGREGMRDFTAGYFHMTPTVAALTMLSKFQNNVKNAENIVAAYCQSQVGAVKLVYDQFKPIIGTSSTYLMPGEDMTVTAGIGSFSSAANPSITINGSTQSANADGVATSTFKVSGSGSVHVSIKFKKPDGTDGNVEKDIPYTVGQPSSASISLDKMNVFYIGLDNPITIGSPTGMERTGVTGNGCTISGSGPKRTVKVTGPGECSITVSPQGSTPLTVPYRIKRIPDPFFVIGATNKSRITTVDFKSQQYCRADMGPEFIYDVHYSVVSATVYFAGTNYPNVAIATLNGNSLEPLRSYINKCGPGSSVTFSNIKVSGPDGVRVIDEKSFSLY